MSQKLFLEVKKPEIKETKDTLIILKLKSSYWGPFSGLKSQDLIKTSRTFSDVIFCPRSFCEISTLLLTDTTQDFAKNCGLLWIYELKLHSEFNWPFIGVKSNAAKTSKIANITIDENNQLLNQILAYSNVEYSDFSFMMFDIQFASD